MPKKSIELNIENVISEILNEHRSHLIQKIAEEYVKTKSFKKEINHFDAKEDLILAIEQQMRNAIEGKISGIQDYFKQEFNKYFSDNLTTLTRECIAKYTKDNTAFAELFNTKMTEHINEISLVSCIDDFLSTKQDLFMQVFLKKMLMEKKVD